MLSTGFALTAPAVLRGAGAGVAPSPRPWRIAIYGDSFGQRCQDILGTPNVLNSGVVDPQDLEWASDDTIRVGGVQWGFAAALQDVSQGKYILPYQLNNAIGGFNTGFLSRYASPDTSPYYLDLFLDRMEALPAILQPDAVIFQAGTNDCVTNWSAETSYNQIADICETIITRLGVPVFLQTVLPRGHAGAPSQRIDGVTGGYEVSPGVWTDRRPFVHELNDRLTGAGYTGIENEPALTGMVHLMDLRGNFADGAAQDNDVVAGMTNDGLHISQRANRTVGDGFKGTMDNRFGPVVPQLPAAGDVNWLANGLMSGTGGALTRTGNAATNTGFTINGASNTNNPGIVPDDWTVTTTQNGAATSWNGTDPNNVKGNLQVSKEAAEEGDAIVIEANCASGTTTNANTRAIEVWAAITLPSTDDLAVGEYFEGIARVELLRRSGLPIAGLRGISAELRLTEPDGIARVIRSGCPAPNGTANMGWEDREFAGDDALVVRTPPRIRKSGTYSSAAFAVIVLVEGQAADIDFVVKISQAAVRPLPGR